jgi:midasin (ATPase involved in ribosome maturation)
MQRAERVAKRDENKFLKNRSVAEIEHRYRHTSRNTAAEDAMIADSTKDQVSIPAEETVDTPEDLELDKELYICVTVVRKPH